MVSSSAATARVTAGGLICRRRAVSAKLAVSATFAKTRMACQRSMAALPRRRDAQKPCTGSRRATVAG